MQALLAGDFVGCGIGTEFVVPRLVADVAVLYSDVGGKLSRFCSVCRVCGSIEAYGFCVSGTGSDSGDLISG